ncbi:MAG: TonB-dependent receptor [Rhodocyclaceae bacterium]|jgi:iron complex outermembrane receptor protein|nr:TonB-dependent receptor [Rhodocyclaceae bacterium]
MTRAAHRPVALCLLLAAAGAGAQERAHANDAVELPVVNVSAVLDALSEQRFAPGAKIVLDAQQIASLGGLSVAEVLRRIPGLDRAGGGMSGSAAASARGIGRDSVAILVNGERPSASGRHAMAVVGRLPAGDLERIELVRGASAEHGADAEIVVNLILKAPPKTWSTEVRSVIGWRGGEPNLQLTAGVGGGADGFSWNLPLTANRHRMPVDTRRTREGETGAGSEHAHGVYRVDETIFTPRLSWSRGKMRLSLWPSRYENTVARRVDVVQRAQGESDPTVRRDREDGRTRISRLRVDGERGGGAEPKLGVRLAWMEGTRSHDVRRTIVDGAASGEEPGHWTERSERRERELSGALRLDRPVDAHLVSIGLEAAHLGLRERQAADAAGQARSHAQREERLSLWLQDEWIVDDALILTGGVRADALRQRTEAGRQKRRVLDPSLSLRWEPHEGWVVRASAGHGVRFPKLDERSAIVVRAAGVNSPLEPDRAGNPQLRVERIVRAEFGLERYFARQAGLVGVNFYARRTRDFVEGRTTLEDGRWVERPANVGHARHYGAELSLRADSVLLTRGALEGGVLRLSLTLPRASVADRDLGVRRIANDTPRLLATLSWEQAAARGRTGYGVQIRHASGTRSVHPGKLRARSSTATRVDGHLSRPLAPSLLLRLSVENLFATPDRAVRTALRPEGEWGLRTRDGGERTWLLALEGKW